MPDLRGLTLRSKLLAGFGIVVCMVAALLFFNHRFTERSVQSVESSLNAEIVPLTRLISLQAHIHRMRVLEIELPRLGDYFAVNSHLDLLRTEAKEFSGELASLLREADPSPGMTSLNDAWQRYLKDIEALSAQAASMDMKKVEEISSFESAVRFKSIALALQELSASTAQRARTTRDQVIQQQGQQRATFLGISAGGLLLIALGILLFARNLVQRVEALRTAAQRIASGAVAGEIGHSGSDELAHLAETFDDMRRQVAEREHELRQAKEQQEARVIERTQEVIETNRLLQLEVEERKRAEAALQDSHDKLEARVQERTRALQQSELRFRDIADSTSDWIWETDSELRFTYFSDRAAECSGRSIASMLGKTLEELAREGGGGELPKHWAEHAAQVTARRPYRAFDYSLMGSDGRLRHIQVTGKPVFESSGCFLGYRGTASDVTRMVLAQQELLDAEKNAALGSQVAGIAHEINTPVGIAVTASSYQQEQIKDFAARYAVGGIRRSELDSFVRAMSESTNVLATNLQRAIAMIKSFKQVAVDQSSDARRSFLLGEYLHEIIDSLRPRLKHTEHAIRIDCPNDLELDSYPGAISQIITNLVLNSLQHAFADVGAGHIEIVATCADDTVSLSYSDDGCGMNAEQVARIFEPFFTTRRNQGGSGLGMHIVHTLVTTKLHGRLECHSAPGCGIRFLMTLPRVSAD